MADARGTHGLSCRLAYSRMARHHEVNDLVWRALCKANVPSIKQSCGLVRDDGKRPDGSTLIPWLAGKLLAWDVTVVNTLAEPSLISQSLTVKTGQRSQRNSSLKGAHIF